MELQFVFLLVTFLCTSQVSDCNMKLGSTYSNLLREISNNSYDGLNAIFSIYLTNEPESYSYASTFLQNKIHAIHKYSKRIYELRHIPAEWNSKAEEKLQYILQASKQLKGSTHYGRIVDKKALSSITAKILVISRNVNDLAQDYYSANKIKMKSVELENVFTVFFNNMHITSDALQILPKNDIQSVVAYIGDNQ